MTALENVAAPLELAGASDASERARAELEQVGLGDRLTHYPAQLSGGEQQRVALARALCPRPSLLIADEPTGNLDETTGRAIIDMMFDLPARRGATLALVTHDATLAARCDRVIRMRSGRIEEEPFRSHASGMSGYRALEIPALGRATTPLSNARGVGGEGSRVKCADGVDATPSFVGLRPPPSPGGRRDAP